MRSKGRLLGSVCGWIWLLQAQSTVVTGPQTTTFFSDVDNSQQAYALYVPREYSPARKWPVVVSLHGEFSSDRMNLRRVFGKGNRAGETERDALRRMPALRDVPYFVVSPEARGTMGYQGIAEKDVYDALADVKRRFAIDEDRVYLTGVSVGGGGALWLGLTHPDLWAAIAPVCPAAPPGTGELVGNAAGTPIHLFQGELDPLVTAASTREWHKRLLEAGARVEYKEYVNVRHNAWDTAYRDGAVFDWFGQFSWERFPNRVRLAAREYRYSSAYWVRLLHIEAGQLGQFDASFTAANQLTVKQLEHVDAFALTLDGHPQYRSAQPLMLQIEGTTMRLRGRGAIVLVRRQGRWIEGSYTMAPEAKAPGREGPMLAAVSSRHVYVYGTKDAPSPEERQRREDAARQAADWSTAQGKLTLKLRVVSDQEITADDVRTENLILFGTAQSNSQIAALTGPPLVSLNASAADYGLVYIRPTGNGHYALISSGLPWWTATPAPGQPALSELPRQIKLLQSFPDYLLFRGTLANVVHEGYFDDQWRVPAEARAILMSTGAVTF